MVASARRPYRADDGVEQYMPPDAVLLAACLGFFVTAFFVISHVVLDQFFGGRPRA